VSPSFKLPLSTRKPSAIGAIQESCYNNRMNDQPLVTIITPSYNQGRFIGETIASVLAQSYPHIEYIIMDGGSSDETLDIIRRYEDDPRLTWVSEPDNGMVHALNKGFARGTGQIMGWLNSDDVFIGQPVADTVAFFNTHADIDLIYGDAVFTDEGGNPTGKRQIGRPFDFIRTLSYLNCVPQPGTLWRRGLWKKAGPLREDLHWSMDSEYWLRMSLHGKFQYIPGDRGTYRRHPDAKTMQDEPATLAFYKLIDEFLADPETYPEVNKKRRLIESNRSFQLAKAYRRVEKHQEARRYARRALVYSPLRRRWPAIFTFCVDAHLGTNLADGLNAAWNRLKPKR
jgi:glycosyltransferase involved in cell wall biosynthesis